VRPHTSESALTSDNSIPDLVRTKSEAILQEAKLKKDTPTSLLLTHDDLIAVCEASFNRCFRTVSTDVLKEVKDEMHRSIVAFRKEIAGGLKTLEGARDNVTALMIEELRSEFNKIREESLEAQKEAQTSQESILVSLKEKTRQEMIEYFKVGNQDYQKELIDTLAHLSDSLEQVRGRHEAQAETHRDEIKCLRQNLLQAHVEASQVHSAEMADLTAQLSEFRAAHTGTAEKLQRIDDENSRRHADLVDVHLSKFLSKEGMKGAMGFSDLERQIANTHRSVNADVGVVLGEIGRIQKAMHMDYVKDLSGYAVRTGTRYREQALQTDPPNMGESAAQTVKVALNDEGAQTVETGEPKVEGFMNILPVKKKKHRRHSSHRKPPKPIPPRNLQVKKTKVFGADADAMKAKARQALMRPQFNVLNLYKRTGWMQHIARSQVFENVTFAVIFLNAVWIAIDMDLNEATLITEANPIFYLVENLFCTYFTLEVLIRFLAFEKKRSCFLDYWFLFDSCLVILMVLETWVIMIVMAALDSGGSVDFLGNLSILRMVRLIKLARMARLARLLRAIPELVVLIKGILVAARSVFLVFLLWLIIIYFYAMVFRQITDGEDVGRQYFETVPDAMNTLLLNCILPETAAIVHDMSGEMPVLWPVILSFILLTSLTIANMLVGVLVRVVSAISETEKESMLVSSLVYEIKVAFYHLNRDPHKSISKEEFEALLVEPEIAIVIKNAGVDVVTLLDMSEMVFENMQSNHHKDSLDFEDFIDLVLSMRGTNPATVKDVKEHLKVVKTIMLESSTSLMTKMDNEFSQIQNLMAEQMSDLRADLASDSEEGMSDDDRISNFSGAMDNHMNED